MGPNCFSLLTASSEVSPVSGFTLSAFSVSSMDLVNHIFLLLVNIVEFCFVDDSVILFAEEFSIETGELDQHFLNLRETLENLDKLLKGDEADIYDIILDELDKL